MANNYFVEGKLYTNRNTDFYGTDPSSVVTNRQSESQPTITWLCNKVTPTFAVFKSRSGSPNGTVHRLRVYRDKNGDYVFPRNRFSGAPVFRSLPSYNLFRDWVNYPTLNSTDSNGSFGPSISFTRGSTATFTGSNGLIQTAAINAPRFDYNPITRVCKGLLIEEARTNLLTQSKGFSAGWTSAGSPTLAYNAVTSPDGATNATGWTRTTTAASYTGKAISKAAAAITYTFSIYAKANVGAYLSLRFQSNSPAGKAGANFNLNTGSISTAAFSTGVFSAASASIQSVGNGWYRCIVTGTSDATNTLLGAYFSFNSNNTGVDGTDSASTSSGYVYGAQLEAGAFATSYIPTTTATVTRSASVATITGTDFTSFYNQSTGSFVLSGDIIGLKQTGGSWPIMIADTYSFQNYNAFREGVIISGMDVVSVSGGVAQADTGSSSVVLNAPFIRAFAYQTNSLSYYSNGTLVGTDNSSVFPTAAPLQFLQIGFNNSNMHISGFSYYPTRLLDSQLQDLTN